MYSLKELRTWWEVPAIAHFFSLFKSCFLLTDFTIEELEDALMTDGEDDKSTIFTSRLLTELLQGCYDNPNISVTTYHESLIDIMKKRWEGEDGRVNPLSSINSDFHSLPTQLKVQIIHRLTEYRLDAQDVADKLAGLNPSDLRLEPLGADRHGSRYWYFFGVRLYKETPSDKVAKKRKREEDKKGTNKRSKPNMTSEKPVIDASHTDSEPDEELYDFSQFFTHHHANHSVHGKKKKPKKKKKHKKGKEGKFPGFPHAGLSDNMWEVVCYNVNDWNKLSTRLENGTSRREESLRQLIVDNFLPNLPKIVEDMEQQKKNKNQLDHPRRSSCRLLAKKLYEEEDEMELSAKVREKLVAEREERVKIKRKEDEERLASDFKKMLGAEIERIHKERHHEWLKKQEEEKAKRLAEGLPIDSASSSDEAMQAAGTTAQPKRKPLRKIQQSAKTSFRSQKDSTGKNGKNGEATSKEKTRLNSATKNSRGGKKSSTSRRSSVQSRKSSKEVESSQEDEEEEQDDDLHQQLLDRIAGNKEYTAMKQTWELLDNHPDAWPFQCPVEEWYAPGYHNIIKRPMDLSTIEGKLDKREYKKVSAFKDDITLMFNNCRLYNGPESEYTQLANDLDKLFKANLFGKLSSNKTPTKPRKGRTTKSESQSPAGKENNGPSKENGSVQLMDEVEEDDADEEEEDDEEESSSSDEFTPPGVSKAQAKKKRLEIAKTLGVIKDKPASNKAKIPAKGKNTARRLSRRTSSDARTKPTSKRKKSESEDDDEEQDDPAPVKKTQRRSSVNRGRGRGQPNNRPRRASVTTRSKLQRSDSESEEEKLPPRMRAGARRGARGGRGGSLKGRPRRASVQQNKAASVTKTDSSELDDSDNEEADGELSEQEENNATKDDLSEDVVDNTDALSTDNEKEEEMKLDATGSSIDAAEVMESEEHKEAKGDDSPLREGDSSSSSSRASSPSPSLEKFEKLEEDAKSKPQVLWSLDYLASQARVLEEQHRKLEASTSNTRTENRKQSIDVARKNSSQPSTPASDTSKPAEDSRRPTPSPLSSGSRQRGRNSLSNPSPVVPSPQTEDSVKAKRFGLNRNDAESDPYSFNDEDSPAALFAKKPETEASHVGEVAHKEPRSVENTAMGPPLPSPRPSPRLVEQHTQDRPVADSYKSKFTSPVNNNQPSPRNIAQSPHSRAIERSPASVHNAPVGKAVPTPPRPMSREQVTGAAPKVPASPHAQQQKMNIEQPAVAAPATSAQEAVAPAAGSRSLSALNNMAQRYPEKPESSYPYAAPPTSNNAHSSALVQQQPGVVPPPPMPNPARPAPQQPPAPSPHQQAAAKSPRAMYQQSPSSQYKRSDGGEQLQAQQAKAPVEKPKQVQQTARQPAGNNAVHRPQQQHIHKLAISVQSQQQQQQAARSNSYNAPQAPQPPSAHDGTRRHSAASAGQGYEQRAASQSRSMDGPYQGHQGPTAGQQQQQSAAYGGYGSAAQTQVPRRSSATSAPRSESTSSYSHAHEAQASTPPLLHNPTMASFGLSPWSLSQANEGQQHPSHNSGGNRHNAQRKSGSNTAGSGSGAYPSGKATSHGGGGNSMSASMSSQSVQQQQQHYHTPPATSAMAQQQNTPSTGSHQSSNKHRTQSTDAGNKPRNNVASNNSGGQTAPGRRQSGNSSQQYQKTHTDYMGYHIPPTPAPTPRDARTPAYSPHQQNGLLSAAAAGAAANNNTALLHQDLTASATLRALQQQHKSDRPAHAAASMLHYAATQGAVAAANEQYSRLANAHHRATPQHAHPLAGVYHHHQNASSSSTHQAAAAHLSTPWLQAAAAAPPAGYPSNLLASPHMDPVYHLMQQSGMHGQYSMYSNPVMQQLHQQHLQHHMLPKY